jgi:hypothetical protein
VAASVRRSIAVELVRKFETAWFWISCVIVLLALAIATYEVWFQMDFLYAILLGGWSLIGWVAVFFYGRRR